VHIFKEFAESVDCSFQAANPKDVETVLRQGASFIKTANVDFSSNVNSTWRNAINAELLQPSNGEAGSNR
jgi:hypothetical protein